VKSRKLSVPGNQRGMALVLSLLVLMALTALVAAMAVNVVQEKTVTVNHRVANRTLYAADSGIEAARECVSIYARAKLDSLANAWAGTGPIIRNTRTFFPAQGITVASTGMPAFTATTLLTFQDSTLDLRSQAYNYGYVTTAQGQYQNGARQVIAEGRYRVSATRGSFADYLIFTDTHAMPGGSAIWFYTNGHFDGRVHTNGEFRLANFPTFEDLVTSVNQKAWFYNNGRNIERDASSNGTIDVPNFYGGFQRGVTKIDLPANSFSQERAAIGGNAADTAPVTNAEIRTALGLTAGSTAPPDGVYVPNSGGNLTGGIYVAGNANQVLMSVSGGQQVLTIKDSSNNTTIVRVDTAAGTTQITWPSGTTTTYNGVPRGCLYTKGQVKDLRGPDRVSGTAPPALASDYQVSVVATSDVVITRDLSYENYSSGENVLGIFSSGGSIRIGTTAPNELKVDAYVMASASQKVFSVDSYDSGSYRGQVHLRGGMVTNYYGAFGTFSDRSTTGYGRDFRYDRRGLVPPYYPLTQRFVPDEPQPQVLAWREVEG
jgi:Tfp pilus assembly protein PilX